MEKLDQLAQIQKIDQQNMLGLIAGFSKQISHACEIGEKVVLDTTFGRGISNIVFSGLGGSAIGADVIKSFLQYQSKVPILVNRHYQLPEFVGKETLLVISSYSGDTEETLSSLRDALKRGARILAISSGGKLRELAREHGFPFIEIPKSFPPRAALGYSVIPLLLVLSKLGLAGDFHRNEISEVEGLLEHLCTSQFGVEVPTRENQAKQFASYCYNRYPIIYSGTDFFDVVALRWRGQIEENAKALASHHTLPEMNHNELVGWKYPVQFLKNTIVFILRDESDHQRVQMRMDLTRGIIKPLASDVIDIHSQGKSLIARIFSLIYLGDWISFYLAILNGINPTPVEVIQFLKSELAKEQVAL